jgi:hypothetical protein
MAVAEEWVAEDDEGLEQPSAVRQLAELLAISCPQIRK